ncbi:MAG: hypothetical protein IJE28_07705 [Oscillospiraceae bacterium]|nr:hypothetical protein [Oscillospiraceae bacterium]
MLHFLNSIKVDKKTMRFYAECSLCGKRKLGPPVPILCRGRKRLENCEKGKSNPLSQKVFNHAKAAAMQILAVHFNQCRSCLEWVCDDCYDKTIPAVPAKSVPKKEKPHLQNAKTYKE